MQQVMVGKADRLYSNIRDQLAGRFIFLREDEVQHVATGVG